MDTVHEDTGASLQPQHKTHYRRVFLLLLIVGIVAAVGGFLYYFTSQKQNSPDLKGAFTPIATLPNCGVDSDFLSKMNKNPLVSDVRMAGAFKGTVSEITKDTITLKNPTGLETIALPLLGREGVLAQTAAIVYSVPATGSVSALSKAQPLSSVSSGQTVSVAYTCRPQLTKSVPPSPVFEINSIFVNP